MAGWRYVIMVGLALFWFGTAQAEEKGKTKGRKSKSGRQVPQGDKKEKSALEVIKEGPLLIVRGLHGGEPQLTDEQNKKWLLDGPVKDELLRLNGHKVKIWATAGEKKLTMSTLEVRQYEILDSGGGKPLVGLLQRARTDGGYILEQKEGKLLIEGKPALRKQLDRWVACKIWIMGELTQKTIKAYKFGWLSCKKPRSIKSGKEKKQ